MITTPSEDCGLALGQALNQALADRRGICRYASQSPADGRNHDDGCRRPSPGRPFLVWDVEFPREKIGTFDTELVREFFNGLVQARPNHPARQKSITGSMPIILQRLVLRPLPGALRAAVEPDLRAGNSVPSTKGHFEQLI